MNQKGVLLTSLAEIAAKLGVTRGAMYHYVADREDLVFQCYRRAAEIIARHLREAERVGGTSAEVLVDFISRMLDPEEPEIAARAEIAMMNQTQRDTIQGLYDALTARLGALARDRAPRRGAASLRHRGECASHSQPGDLGAAGATLGACGRADGRGAIAVRGDGDACWKDSRPARSCRTISRWIFPSSRRKS